MQVVNLGSCRELLKAWEAVRTEILKGNVRGMTVRLQLWDGDSRIMFAGDGDGSSLDAAREMLHLSWEITKENDFQTSRM